MVPQIHIEGKEEITGGLANMTSAILGESQQFLDRVADQTVNQMKSEAPKRTGMLANSVSITYSDATTRVVEPTARNFSPGNTYGLPVETGTGQRGPRGSSYTPNPQSIALYYGVDLKTAWAIALSIKNKGTPANPFVERTWQWTQTMINAQIPPFLGEIVSAFAVGNIGSI